MDLSIIIPAHNTEQFIGELIESLLNQKTKYTYEIIFVLDSCTDNTKKVIDDSKIQCKIIECEKHSCGLARNIGLDISLGEYIWFIDSDDYLIRDDAIEIALNSVKDKDIIKIPFISDNFNIDYYSMVWQYIFSKKLIGDLRFLKIQPNEDVVFMEEIFKKIDVSKIIKIKEPLYFYRYLREGSNMYKVLIERKELNDDMTVVGIPVYHSRETLPHALDSLVLQTKRMFMVMIVNDADGEDYSDIIEDYKKRGLKITYVVQDENGGPGKCRQRVIDSCPMCEYIMFLDSDDMYSPIAVESLTRAIQQKNLDVVMGNCTQMSRGMPAYRADVNSTSITWVWNKIYRRQYLIDNNIRFPDDLRVDEDIAFSLPVWNGTEKKLRIEQDVYYWCDNKNSLTRIEGKTEFDKKNIADFVKAQVYGLEKIEEMGVEISPRLFAPTLKIIYTQISTANALGATEDGYIDVLKRLNNLMAMGYFENNFESWAYIVNNCPAGIVTDSNDVIFFKERFVDWFNRVFSD